MTATSAKPQPTPRHRAAPRLVPTPVMLLVLWLGVLSVWAPQPFSRVLGGLALIIGATYFIQRWRRAAWDMTVGATQELDR